MKMKWFEMWFSDKEAMLDIMIHNMVADLDCGYNYFGDCIKKQRADIAAYKEQFDNEVKKLQDMDEARAERWCYMDLRRRGAIA